MQQTGTDTISDRNAESGLERRLDLTAIPLEWGAWIVVVLVALAIRLPGRTSWPLSEGESAIARDAWALLQGNDLSSRADAHPLMVQLTSLSFFLFGDTDFTARLIPLIAGVGVLAALCWLRTWFGALPAISIAIIWTLSPVMTISTLRLDGGAVLLLATLFILALTMTMSMDSRTGKAVALGVAIAAGLTAHPLAWLVVPLTLLPAMVLMRDFRLGGQLLTTITAAVASLLVLTSWFATRPAAVGSFFAESLSTLWQEHLAQLGSAWQATVLVLLIDEPVILLLIAIGVGIVFAQIDWDTSIHPALFVGCVAWATPMLTLGILLSGKGPALYVVTLFPLVVIAGLGLSILLDGVRYAGWQNGHPALWSGVLLVLLIAIVRFGDLLARGPDGDSIGWLVNAVALGLLIVLPLGYVAIRLAAGTRASLVPVTVLMVIVLAGAIGMRSSILFTATGTDRPGELLVAGSTLPAVGHIENRLGTYSRDSTRAVQDVRDPTGGHGLSLVIDAELADPFSWYFRNFPDIVIIDGIEDLDGSGVRGVGDEPDEATGPDVAITSLTDAEEWEDVLTRHQARTYPVRYIDPSGVEDNQYRDLLINAFNPLEFRNLVNFAVYRNAPGYLEHEEMVLFLRDDHATSIWGPDAFANPE